MIEIDYSNGNLRYEVDFFVMGDDWINRLQVAR